MVSELRRSEIPSKSGRAITKDSWIRSKGSMGSSSHFKFTKGEVEAKKIIRVAQQKHLVAYLKVTSMGSPDLRVEGKAYAFLTLNLAIMRGSDQNRRDTSLDDDKNHSRGIFNDQRNDRCNGKGKRNTGHQGNGRLFKESKELQV